MEEELMKRLNLRDGEDLAEDLVGDLLAEIYRVEVV